MSALDRGWSFPKEIQSSFNCFGVNPNAFCHFEATFNLGRLIRGDNRETAPVLGHDIRNGVFTRPFDREP
jgi:hypothetical protein